MEALDGEEGRSTLQHPPGGLFFVRVKLKPCSGVIPPLLLKGGMRPSLALAAAVLLSAAVSLSAAEKNAGRKDQQDLAGPPRTRNDEEPSVMDW